LSTNTQCKLPGFKYENDPTTLTVFAAPKSCSVHWASLSTSSHWRPQLSSLRFEAFKTITLTEAFLAYQPRQSWVEIQHFGDLPQPLAQGRCPNHEDGKRKSLQGSAMTQLWGRWKPK